MSGVRSMSWYVAVALLAVATVVSGKFALAADAGQSQFCEDLVTPYGYLCAEYRTYSADGYELVMHRVGSRPRQRLDKTPVSQTSETDTASLNCDDVEQPFNSHKCLQRQPSSKRDIPESDKVSAPSGLHSSDYVSVYQNLPYPMDQAADPSRNPTILQDGAAQVQERLPGRGPFWRDEDQGSPHPDLPSQDRFEALPRKVQLPIHRPRKSSLSDTRTGGKDHNGSLVSKESADSPQSSGLQHPSHDHTGSNGSNLPTVSEGPATKEIVSESTGPVESAPGISRGNPAANKSKTSDRHASVPSPSPSGALSKVVAISASSRNPTHDPNSDDFITRRVPVLVMHQEFLNGDSWFQFTDAADRLLPLLLVDAGFDVWIGHERATYWSHGHLHLRHDEQTYWNWTWDEHAKYDVPALLELINNETGFAAHYVGLSQSATVGAAAATMPESSKFMRSLTLIGPTIYRGYSSSIVLNAWAFLFGNTIDQTYYDEGYQNGAFNITRAFPITAISGRGPAGIALGTISGPNCCFGSTVVPFTNGWDGTISFKNLLHYQQGVRTNFWRHFDLGDAEKNTQAYGTPYAPNYLPEDIPTRIPVLVVYGGQDLYAPVAGMTYLLSRLGNRSESVFVPAYAHYDLTYSVNRTQDVFIPILRFLEAHR